jgi:hypothetical protein
VAPVRTPAEEISAKITGELVTLFETFQAMNQATGVELGENQVIELSEQEKRDLLMTMNGRGFHVLERIFNGFALNSMKQMASYSCSSGNSFEAGRRLGELQGRTRCFVDVTERVWSAINPPRKPDEDEDEGEVLGVNQSAPDEEGVEDA